MSPHAHPAEPGPESGRSFLEALFGDAVGLLEVRVIVDKKGGDVVERRWYETTEELSDDLARLKELAGSRSAGVLLGVLPRTGRGGTKDDIAPGNAVWVDLDFKAYADGEQEARDRLGKLPCPPSIVVFSGHGLHGYWLLHEAEDPQVLSDLSRGVGGVLGGDNTHDVARLLRMPGTANYKDPDDPIPTGFEVLKPDRRYNPSEIQDALDMCGWDPGERSSSTPVEVTVAERMSDRVLALLDTDKRINALFNGTGKPVVGADGRRLDTTTSGYDFSFVFELARLGVDDPSELATALSCRPDGSAREKGTDYLARTVSAALDRAQKAADVAETVVDFEVERVRVLASDRSTYELTIDGQILSLTSAQLRSKGAFATRYLQVLHRIPDLPQKADDWNAFVNSLLERAEVVELGEDASEAAALREDVQAALDALQEGEELEDLDRGLSLKTSAGKVGFKVAPLLKHLQEQRPELTRHALCVILRDLGYETGPQRFDGKVVRLWT